MLPRVNITNKMTAVQEEFRGLNHNSFLQDTELYNMKNMSADFYPYAGPRRRRARFAGFGEHLNGIATKQGFCFVEGTDFYYRGNKDDKFHWVGKVTDTPKQFVSLGAYVIIFPDKKYFWSLQWEHRNDPTDEWFIEHGLTRRDYFGDLEAHESFTTFTMKMCNVYGDDYKITVIGDEQPDEECEVNGTIWLDTSGGKSRLMEYSAAYSGWIEITSTYIKIELDKNLEANFSDFDGVALSDMPEVFKDFNSTTVLYKVVKTGAATSYIVIPGIFFGSAAAETESQEYEITFNELTNALTVSSLVAGKAVLTIDRKVPDMDFVCEQDNRLWGCSNENHEIYISKQGSPFNFNCFLGLSTDSDVITIGSDGDFTGCISHLGYVLFFKEDRVHKIYGTKPSNYQVTEVALRGVQKGCERSLCIVNETLYYKSKVGVMSFQGALPELISKELGEDIYTEAVAGQCKNKYYISMKERGGEWNLFVFDCDTGMWHREDGTHFKNVLSTLDELYYIDGADSTLKTVLGSGNAFTVARPDTEVVGEVDTTTTTDTTYTPTAEDAVEWEMETGDLYDGSVDNKFIGRLRIVAELQQDTEINIFLKYDNEKKWNHVLGKHYKYQDGTKNTFNIPVIPRRARRMKMKISGKGACLIMAIAKTVEQGSER